MEDEIEYEIYSLFPKKSDDDSIHYEFITNKEISRDSRKALRKLIEDYLNKEINES